MLALKAAFQLLEKRDPLGDIGIEATRKTTAFTGEGGGASKQSDASSSAHAAAGSNQTISGSVRDRVRIHRAANENADGSHVRRLRMRGERPRCSRARQRRDDLATFLLMNCIRSPNVPGVRGGIANWSGPVRRVGAGAGDVGRAKRPRLRLIQAGMDFASLQEKEGGG